MALELCKTAAVLFQSQGIPPSTTLGNPSLLNCTSSIDVAGELAFTVNTF